MTGDDSPEPGHARTVDDASFRWVELLLCQTLQERGFTPEFGRQCRDVAVAAARVRRLRRASARVGFVPLPFSDYMEHIAHVAGVSLGRVLDCLGIRTGTTGIALDTPTQGATRLAAWMGFPLNRLLAHLGLSLLTRAGRALPEAACLRLETGHDIGASCLIDELDSVFRSLPPAWQRRWLEIKQETVATYGPVARAQQADREG